MPTSILLVEDHPETARLLQRALATPDGSFQVTLARSAQDAVERLAGQPFDCVLLDYALPDAHGLDCLRRIRTERPLVAVVMITGSGSEEVAVEAMKLGAVDYVVKHGPYVSSVPRVVREAIGRATLARSASELRGERIHAASARRLDDTMRARARRAGLIGDSPAMERTLVAVDRAARSDATVLLEGETGTGKELLARAIHACGSRAERAFIVQNCAALPEGLLESELFGFVRGAFTGADRTRRGLFEEAHGGTLFLDEVSEATPASQAKLLRVLQDGEIRPIGSNVSRRVDVRVIVACNRDLRLAAEEGRFRLDLYHRLSVFPIRVPPLRERREDVRVLAAHFLALYARRADKAVGALSREALQLFGRYAWPGNVRELQNEIQRLVLRADPEERIGAELVSPWIADAATPGLDGGARPLKEIVRDVELATICSRMRENGYQRSLTARSLGLTREGLWLKLRQLGWSPPRRGSTD